MPRIVNGIIQPSEKKKGYERIDQQNVRSHDIENPFRKCKCDCGNCNFSDIDCTAFNCCICSCCNFTFYPQMLLTVDALIGYLIIITSTILLILISWEIGLIISVLLIISYAFLLRYRCCMGNDTSNRYDINAANRDRQIKLNNKKNKNKPNPNRKTGIMGIDDLPKQKKGG